VNIGLLLDMVADGAPDRIVLGSREGGITAGELLGRARAAGLSFIEAGVDHVGFVDLNSEAFPLTMLGAAVAGLPFAPVNYRLTDEQLAAILGRLKPAVVVAGPDVSGRLAPSDGLQIWPTAEVLGLAPVAEADELPFVDPDEIGVLLFTSGTTGEPKAAVLRHRHLTSYILSSVEFLGADEDEAQLVCVPAYHVAGIAGVLSCLFAGRRLVYLPAFEPQAWVDLVRREGITQAMLVPTMLGRILPILEAGDADLPTLKHLSYGGGRMPPELIERAMKVLPDVDFVNAYGLTETSSTVAVLTPDDHRGCMSSADPLVRRRIGSVGRPLPSVEIEIRDAGGRVVVAGERGEIYLRGDQVAGEYLGRSVLTDDGWFPTNDAGWLDHEGFLFLDGRLDDVIVRGAENLSPGEIEDTLLGHPFVVEAAVVGIPDTEWGEAVAAAVVLAAGSAVSEAELQDWVRERLRSTKTPSRIQFRDEMPYNETGKLLRRVIKADLAPE
jgi:acyl-CoA synthetase (AMP-forming)/AMP-acid ligase II